MSLLVTHKRVDNLSMCAIEDANHLSYKILFPA